MQVNAGYSTLDANHLRAALLPCYRNTTPTACRFWQRGVNDAYRIDTAGSPYSLRV